MSGIWTKVGPADSAPNSARHFDQAERSFAIVCDALGQYYCTDGLCTHLQAHLADGKVENQLIICPMHGGAFDFRTGAAEKMPACKDLQSHPCKVVDGVLWIFI